MSREVKRATMKRFFQKTCVWIAWKSGGLLDYEDEIVRAYLKETRP
jgi:hypothetical protein